MGKQPFSVQQESFAIPSSRSDNTNRCFNGGLGCSMPRDNNRGSLVHSRETTTYQCFGIKASKISHSNIPQDKASKFHSPADRQYDSIVISSENGGYPQHDVDPSSQRNMGLLNPTQDHDYCRIHPKQTKYRSRLAIQTCEGLKRVEVIPKYFQTNNKKMGDSRHGSFCLKDITPSTSLHVLETRSILQSNRCISTKLASPLFLCFPPILTNREGTEKSTEGQSKNGNYNTSMAIPSLVSYITSNVCNVTYTVTSQNRLTPRPLGTGSSSNTVKISTSGGMDGFRKHLAAEGISEQATMLITNARRAGTISNYESSWGKWSSWCLPRQIDPFRCSLNYILDFLAELFTNGLAYRTINCHRSALSAYHDASDGFPVGQHPRVTAVMTGIFNKRPPQPRYAFIWDVEKVLMYLRKLYPNESLTDKDLTLKTTMLLALTAASRSLEIKNLDIRFMTKSGDSYTFTFAKLFKSWKKGKAPPCLEYLSFPTEVSLCVYESLTVYLQRSAQWRQRDQKQLLLSHIKPHQEVSRSTISRWIVEMLENSGIDTRTFKAHSVRSASSSKAKINGLSTPDILCRGNWSKASTFQKFYNKEILVEKASSSFQKSIFNKQWKTL